MPPTSEARSKPSPRRGLRRWPVGRARRATAKSEGALTQALVRLNAVAEAYPDLKANANFSALQAELGATEDRIASARRYYNANVRELNTKVESIPTNFVAGPAGVHKAEYFELDAPAEREAPKVSFDPAGSPQLPPAAPAPAPVQDAPAYPQTPPPTAPGSPWGQPPTTPQS
jgi:LemA protein